MTYNNEMEREEEEREFLGPLLKFNGEDDDNIWKVSVLIFLQTDHDDEIVTLYSNRSDTPSNTSFIKTMENIGTMYEYTIFRGELKIKLENTRSQMVGYWFSFNEKQKWYFYAPRLNETPRFFFFSCNGFHSKSDRKKYGGIDGMWKQMDHFQENEIRAHLLIGGGDQIYCDEIWEIPELKNWNKNSDFTHVDAVQKAYWKLYKEHFFGKDNTGFRKCLSSIPYFFNWDDHDITDGWGSYEDRTLQQSPTFKSIFTIAKMFYMLIQHHKTPKEYVTEKPDHSVFKARDLLFVGLDTRTERSPVRVISSEGYHEVDRKLRQALESKKFSFIFFIIPIPLVYPNLTRLKKMSDNFLFENLSIIQDRFHKVAYQDDLVDQWTFENHEAERERLIHYLTRISSEFKTRVAILTGDIHSCALGYINSKKPVKFAEDTNGIYQIISSPIGNSPMMGALNAVVNIKFHDDILHPKPKENENQNDEVWESDLHVHLEKLRNDKYFVNERNFCSFSHNHIRLYLESRQVITMELKKLV